MYKDNLITNSLNVTVLGNQDILFNRAIVDVVD